MLVVPEIPGCWIHATTEAPCAAVFLLCYPEQPVSAVKAKICQIFKRCLAEATKSSPE